MRIYRVEHKSSTIGPFNHSNTYETLFGYGHPARSLPVLKASHAGKYDWDLARYYRTGCRTLAQLIRWFPEDTRKALHGRGFILRVYDVKKILAQDDSQVVAHLPKGKRPVARLSLLDVVEENA